MAGFELPAVLLALAGGYLLGSTPFGLVMTSLAGLGDIRKLGSGNIGATNVLRTGRKDLALATLLLDAGKAGLAAIAGTWLGDARLGMLAGAAAFVGHCFPVWLGFKGGKGVATFIGLLLATAWQAGLAFAAVWLMVAGLFRISSLAALIAAAASPVAVMAFGYGPFHAGVAAALCVLIFLRHRSNIARLVKGEEPKIGKKG
jgi:glycerol-3-phosphate acyltransferase PlsY